MSCSSCNGVISTGDKFCPHCGAEVCLDANHTQAVPLSISQARVHSHAVISSNLDRLHEKCFSKALVISTEGGYQGEWEYFPNSGIFASKYRESSGDVFERDHIVNRFFSVADVVSIEKLNEKRNVSGVAAGAVVGAVVAGAAGALAGGAFVGMKNSYLVEIILKNGQKLHGYISQLVYDAVIMSARSSESNEFLGLEVTRDIAPLRLLTKIIIFYAVFYLGLMISKLFD